jgi:hypothetical protein
MPIRSIVDVGVEDSSLFITINSDGDSDGDGDQDYGVEHLGQLPFAGPNVAKDKNSQHSEVRLGVASGQSTHSRSSRSLWSVQRCLALISTFWKWCKAASCCSTLIACLEMREHNQHVACRTCANEMAACTCADMEETEAKSATDSHNRLVKNQGVVTFLFRCEQPACENAMHAGVCDSATCRFQCLI